MNFTEPRCLLLPNKFVCIGEFSTYKFDEIQNVRTLRISSTTKLQSISPGQLKKFEVDCVFALVWFVFRTFSIPFTCCLLSLHGSGAGLNGDQGGVTRGVYRIKNRHRVPHKHGRGHRPTRRTSS